MTNDQAARKGRTPPHARVLTAAIVAAVGWVIGGCSTSASPSSNGLGNGSIGTITKSGNDSSFRTPFDATPSPDGKTVYFTAIGTDGTAGVFMVAASGGASTRLDMGGVLVSPFGIAITEDGKTLYVADPAEYDETTGTYGAVYSLAVGGGVPTAVSGTQGLVPRGVVATADKLYFTAGATPKSAAGLYAADIQGGAPSVVASGAPFVAPSGIAVTTSGDAYVADAAAAASHLASVMLVHDGQVTEFATDLGVGYPAGIALVQDESALLVSGRDPSDGTDLVYRITLGSSPEISSFNTTIGAFHEAAGLHRAPGADIYAWADSRANSTGTVYTLGK